MLLYACESITRKFKCNTMPPDYIRNDRLRRLRCCLRCLIWINIFLWMSIPVVWSIINFDVPNLTYTQATFHEPVSRYKKKKESTGNMIISAPIEHVLANMRTACRRIIRTWSVAIHNPCIWFGNSNYRFDRSDWHLNWCFACRADEPSKFYDKSRRAQGPMHWGIDSPIVLGIPLWINDIRSAP